MANSLWSAIIVHVCLLTAIYILIKLVPAPPLLCLIRLYFSSDVLRRTISPSVARSTLLLQQLSLTGPYDSWLTNSNRNFKMGLLDEPFEPRTPPPSWSPARLDFWKKPSKWQIHMPRLTILAKLLASFFGFVLLVKIIGQKPAAPSTPLEPPEPPSENDMKAAAERMSWIWKDFTM